MPTIPHRVRRLLAPARCGLSHEESSWRAGVKVAIVGSPNVGKSTLFTRLTKQIAHIANWPGTTVERKEGLLHADGRTLILVDTPGVYSLSGVSVEERVTRDYLLEGDWDAVVVLVDSLAPEKTLYLALHVLEITGRAVVALTKWDAAHAKGVHIHVDELERALGVPVVPVSAVTGEGLGRLVREVLRVAEGGPDKPLKLDYGPLESSIVELERLLEGVGLNLRAPPRWIAVKLLEGDAHVAELMRRAGAARALERTEKLRDAARARGWDVEEVLVSARYRFVDTLSRKAVVRLAVAEGRGLLESVLLSPLLGPILSVLLLFSLYLLVFTLNTGFPLNVVFEVLGLTWAAEALERYTLAGAISSLFESLAAWVGSQGLPEPIALVATEGVIPALALVASFLPLIFTALLALSFLEDSGVGPYAAASLHRVLQKLGVSGRAVYPMLIGLGCNVPAVMSVRAVPEEAERRQLYAAVPFIPCQARLVVLLAFASAYFAGAPLPAAGALALVYATELALFAITSRALRRLAGAREPPVLLIELPPIHLPAPRVLWWISWEYTVHYLKRAGIIIFGLTILLWLSTRFGPSGPVETVEQSFAAATGRALAPLMAPFGLAGPRAEVLAFAALAGLVAKETAVLAVAVYVGARDPLEALASLQLSRAQALSLMVFFAAYMPCIATATAVYRETGSAKFALGATAWSIASALLLSSAIYSLTRFL